MTNVRMANATLPEPPLLGGVISILAVGLVLGLGYNAIGLGSSPAWGLSWIGVDRVAEMPKLAGASNGGSVRPLASASACTRLYSLAS